VRVGVGVGVFVGVKVGVGVEVGDAGGYPYTSSSVYEVQYIEALYWNLTYLPVVLLGIVRLYTVFAVKLPVPKAGESYVDAPPVI